MRNAKMLKWTVTAVTAAGSLLGQTQLDLRTQSKNVDFSNAVSTKPAKVGTVLPASCSGGEVFFVSNAPPGQNLYGCTSTNIWTQQAGAGGGTVTHTNGPLGSTNIMTGNGFADSQTPCSGCTLDGSGNQVLTGTLTTSAGSTTAGNISLLNGSDPGTFRANSFSLEAPASIPTAYGWRLPAADAAGLLSSDGGGTPGTLSIRAIQGSGAKILSAGTISGTGTTLCTDASGGASTSGCSTTGYNPLDYTVVQLSDDFIPAFSGTLGQLGWRVSNTQGTGIASNLNPSDISHPGMVEVDTTAGSGDGTILVQQSTSGQSYYFRLGASSNDFAAWETNIILRTDTTITSEYLWAGVVDSFPLDLIGANNSIGVYYNTAAHSCTSGPGSTANLVFLVRAASSDTCVDSGIAVAASTWYRIRIVSTTPGTIGFQVSTNGGSYSGVQNLSGANVPTAAMMAEMGIMTKTAAVRKLFIDRWAFNGTGVNR